MKKILNIRWGEKIGGVESLLKDIARISEKSSFEMVFCFLTTAGSHQSTIQQQNCQVFVIPAASGYDVAARLRLFRLIRDIRPDLIVEHGVPPLIRPVIKIATSAPLVTFDHGCYELYRIKGKHFSNWLIELEYQLCSDFVITNSNYNKQTIVSKYRVENEKVEVIYPGVDIGLFKPIAKMHAQEILTIGYVGRIQFCDKGTNLLIPVAQELLRNKLTNFEIRVFGDGPDLDALKKLADDAMLGRYFTFFGEVTNVADQLTAVDIVVVTSRSEAFGLSPLEALSAGCHVVGFNVGGLKEAVGRCKQAVLVNPFDTSEMANAIINIWTKGGLTADAAASAHNYVADNFSARSFVSKLAEAIKGKLPA